MGDPDAAAGVKDGVDRRYHAAGRADAFRFARGFVHHVHIGFAVGYDKQGVVAQFGPDEVS